MPTEKLFKKELSYIYKKSPEDLMLFGFVRAVTCTMRELSQRKAVEMFKSIFNLSEDDFGHEAARLSFHRMNRQFPGICECGKVNDRHQTSGLCGILQKNAENFIMFGYVLGIKSIAPTTDTLQGVKLFLRSSGISQNELFERYESYKAMYKDYQQLIDNQQNIKI